MGVSVFPSSNFLLPTTAVLAPYLLPESVWGTHVHHSIPKGLLHRAYFDAQNLRHVFASDSASSGAKTDRYDSGVLANRPGH